MLFTQCVGALGQDDVLLFEMFEFFLERVVFDVGLHSLAIGDKFDADMTCKLRVVQKILDIFEGLLECALIAAVDLEDGAVGVLRLGRCALERGGKCRGAGEQSCGRAGGGEQAGCFHGGFLALVVFFVLSTQVVPILRPASSPCAPC